MTPAGHVDRADNLLDKLRTDGRAWDESARIVTALEAVAHACIAIAIELGAPHVSGDTAAASGG